MLDGPWRDVFTTNFYASRPAEGKITEIAEDFVFSPRADMQGAMWYYYVSGSVCIMICYACHKLIHDLFCGKSCSFLDCITLNVGVDNRDLEHDLETHIKSIHLG